MKGSPNWWVKLADFGISKKWTDKTDYKTKIGTQLYMAPEILDVIPDIDSQTSTYTNAVDIWSLGCITFRLAAGIVPFARIISLIQFCENRAFFPSTRLNMGDLGAALVKKFLTPHPSKRVTADQALNDPWMSASKKLETPEGWI